MVACTKKFQIGFMPGEPVAQPGDERAHDLAIDPLPKLGSKDPHAPSCTCHKTHQLRSQQFLHQAIADAEYQQIHRSGVLGKIGEVEMSNLAGGRNDLVDLMIAEPVPKVADIVITQHDHLG